MRIVVVDPAEWSAKMLSFVLAEAGHTVHTAHSGMDAIEAVVGQDTGAVLLEADLPDIDGADLCKELRAQRYTGPIIFVSHLGSTRDKLRAFNHGADDFIVEPFDPAELVARLEAVARRAKQADGYARGMVLHVGDVELSIGELTVRIGSHSTVRLTPTEMRILEYLMRNANITISRETLIERTWGFEVWGETNRVDVYVSRLRKKIERDPAKPEYLQTVRGIGYVFRAPSHATLGRSAAPVHSEPEQPS